LIKIKYTTKVAQQSYRTFNKKNNGRGRKVHGYDVGGASEKPLSFINTGLPGSQQPS
jgi:hypothetical protein